MSYGSWAQVWRVLVLGAAVLTAAPETALGQRAAPNTATLAEAKQLNDKVVELLARGKYDPAIPLAERALAIRERVLGPEHPDIATSLDNLAYSPSRRKR